MLPDTTNAVKDTKFILKDFSDPMLVRNALQSFNKHNKQDFSTSTASL